MNNKSTEITEKQAIEIKTLILQGLSRGLGLPQPGQMCIEHVISFVQGHPSNDNPQCVGNEVRKAKIALNDCDWSSNLARGKGMLKIGLAQLGSDKLNQEEFKKVLMLNSMRMILPFLIQKHYEDVGDLKLLEYKTKFEGLVTLDNKLWEEFYSDHNYYYNYYYSYYYSYYNYYYFHGDTSLQLISNTILKTLQDMDCEGCKWLYLTEDGE